MSLLEFLKIVLQVLRKLWQHYLNRQLLDFQLNVFIDFLYLMQNQQIVVDVYRQLATSARDWYECNRL